MPVPKLGEYKYPYPKNPRRISNLDEKKGFLIEIEGLDGSGKSTQLKLLENKLKRKFSKIFVGNFIHSEYIKDILLKTKYENCDEYTFTLMYIMGLTNFINEEVADKLRDGYIVILDRYIDTIKTKGLVRNVNPKWLKNLLSIYRKPDVNIFIDVDPLICLNRKKQDNNILSYWECGCELADDNLRMGYDKSKYEKNFIVHQSNIRDIIKNDKDFRYIVDGTKDKEKVSEEIYDIILKKMGEKNYEQ